MRSPLHQQVDILPALIESTIAPFIREISKSLTPTLTNQITQIYITGCGDSHHAGINAALAFRQLAGLPCEALPAMEFARYRAPFLPADSRSLVIAVSVSGAVSRTSEACRLGRLAGALAIGVTGS